MLPDGDSSGLSLEGGKGTPAGGMLTPRDGETEARDSKCLIRVRKHIDGKRQTASVLSCPSRFVLASSQGRQG